MDRELFDVYINENAEKIKAISDAAKSLHESVNQTYDKTTLQLSSVGCG